ncbi:hypothetical protein AWR36_004580 [Microbulbifer flavimaris]|uniref:Uncharacterized protein n=1 Tax=Microbulbifer flavimaris TaxID=1781068 RepID=A0ABX4I3M3_9GAMM|nr:MULTISPECIES: hypothetical protein [Microbulbifer]KUJ84918.1 hypothetical protein AVO43_04580 [Microbulbifer sp. ZGT114]PCO07017.1 hypothetical protein AWR36_004580 [Microbulbifer flavimaris]
MRVVEDEWLKNRCKSEQEKGDYLFARLALGYAKVYAFRRSLLGRFVGHLERAFRYMTLRPAAKSELTRLYEAALSFQKEHDLDFQQILADSRKH